MFLARLLPWLFLNGFLLSPCSHADLIATFEQNGQQDSRLDRVPALHVEAKQAATPFLAAGKFRVKWTGFLEIPKRKRFYLSFAGKGEAQISLQGEIVHSEKGSLGKTKSKRLRLDPGLHALEITYLSQEDGAASFRLYWQEDGSPLQTIPAKIFSHKATQQVLENQQKRLGREAFAHHQCAKCHLPEKGMGTRPMPEVMEIAPILSDIGNRVTEAWLAQWIADPKSLKPSTKMPSLIDLTSPQGLKDAADLAAYLSTFQTEKHASSNPSPDLKKQGAVIFHELGCIACHHAPHNGLASADTNRVPLNNLAHKFQAGQLTEYLKNPESYHVFTAMPNFQLSDEEANALAAFLLSESQGKQTYFDNEFPKGDAARGALLAESLDCGSCHPGLPGSRAQGPSLESIFEKNWEQAGCVSLEEKRPHLPKMNYLEGERESLLRFAEQGASSLKQDHPAEFAARQISSKNCAACHALDEIASGLHAHHSSTAHWISDSPTLKNRMDQSRPSLTFMGEMLYSSYIQDVLNGSAQPRARPWLGMRMPVFSTYAAPLATGMANLHGFAASEPEKFTPDPALVKIGRELIGEDGFGCTTCHGWDDQSATAAFEVGAVDFSLSPDRIRKEFYHRWMDHPASITPSTKMPKYSEGNRSKRFDILEGDAHKQYEAIWHWMHAR